MGSSAGKLLANSTHKEDSLTRNSHFLDFSLQQENFSVQHTAYICCALKARQMWLEESESYFREPTARFLAGDIGNVYVRQMRETDENSFSRLFDIVSVRTLFFDNKVRKYLKSGICQICSIGAGFDGRAFRLIDEVLINPGVTYYEVDLPDVMESKARELNRIKARSSFNFIQVCADLRKPDELESCLLKKGFNTFEPTLWLAEGFVVHMEPDEISLLIDCVSRLSCGRSAFICDVITSQFRFPSVRWDCRSFAKLIVDDPSLLFRGQPWKVTCVDAEDIINSYGKRRWCTDQPEINGLKFVISKFCN